MIHGMGEQRPMDTIKAFVKAVWETEEVITANKLPHPTQVWSKPDVRTGSLELRRITTRESIASASFPRGVRTDFYELYWADLTAGSTWDQFTGWVRGLLLRPLSRVPPDVRLAWVVLWIAALAVVALAVLAAVPADSWRKIHADWLAEWHWLLAFVAAAFGAWLHKIATATFGRVVRYTKADPSNIAARQAVRERGLKLLSALHEGTHYKRIIIVSHSLGTMLAHDLLSYFWAQREAPRRIAETSPEFDALCELERAAAAVDRPNPTAAVLDEYYAAQRRLRVALAARPAPPAQNPQTSSDPRWLITDFVTLGSPLAHAEFLIAASAEDLAQRKFERELPESPPLREDLDPNVFRLAQATGKLPVGPDFKTSKLISLPPALRAACLGAASRRAVRGRALDQRLRHRLARLPRRHYRRTIGERVRPRDHRHRLEVVARPVPLLHPHQVLGARRRADPHRRLANGGQSARPARQDQSERFAALIRLDPSLAFPAGLACARSAVIAAAAASRARAKKSSSKASSLSL